MFLKPSAPAAGFSYARKGGIALNDTTFWCLVVFGIGTVQGFILPMIGEWILRGSEENHNQVLGK